MRRIPPRAATAAFVLAGTPLARPVRRYLTYLTELGLAAVHASAEEWTRQPSPCCHEHDITLTPDDRSAFARALARAFRSDATADRILTAVGYPRERRRSIDHSIPELVWAEILDEMDNGVIEAPYRLLLVAALDRFPGNRAFRSLAVRYGLCPVPRDGRITARRVPPRPACPRRGHRPRRAAPAGWPARGSRRRPSPWSIVGRLVWPPRGWRHVSPGPLGEVVANAALVAAWVPVFERV